jgi:hypothetical protein
MSRERAGQKFAVGLDGIGGFIAPAEQRNAVEGLRGAAICIHDAASSGRATENSEKPSTGPVCAKITGRTPAVNRTLGGEKGRGIGT